MFLANIPPTFWKVMVQDVFARGGSWCKPTVFGGVVTVPQKIAVPSLSLWSVDIVQFNALPGKECCPVRGLQGMDPKMGPNKRF